MLERWLERLELEKETQIEPYNEYKNVVVKKKIPLVKITGKK